MNPMNARTSPSGKFSLYLLLPLLAGICWGTTGSFVRVLSGYALSNATILFSRCMPGTCILFVIILLYDRTLLKFRLKDIWIFLCCSLIGMLGLNLCYNFAIVRLSLSFAAVLLSMSPVFVLLLAAVFFHEKITKRKVLCILLALLGCILVSGLLDSIGSASLSAAGIFVGVCSAFFYAIYSIFLKMAANRGYHSLTITFYCMLFLMLALIPLASFSEFGSYLQASPANAFFLLLPALLNAVLPYIFFNIGMAKAQAGIASTLAAGGEPATATVLGVFIFSEGPTILTITGLIITILAMALLLRNPAD